MTYQPRPLTQLAKPTVLSDAFANPDAVLDLIRKGAPYKTQEAAHKHPNVTHTSGWFRNFWALGGKVVFEGAEPFFHNPAFIDAAKASFGAEIIRPVAMMTNLNLPMEGLPPHLDLPWFRGAMNREVPAWMLAPMGYSGLFHRWAVPVASVVTWFYDGAGGEFEYWPDGLAAPSRTMRPPFHNQGVMADNEYMFHRVGALGHEADWLAADAIPYEARLHLEGGEWVVRDGGAELLRYPFADVRLSVLWKAYCFRNEAEATAFDDRSDDLTPELVATLFLDDLAARGVACKAARDDFSDPAWKQVLEDVYAAPTPQITPRSRT